MPVERRSPTIWRAECKAWAQVCRNDGAPGVDGVTIDRIVNSEGGSTQLIEQLQQELREKTYKAQAIRRTYIDKQDGGQRPLGIPTVRDRVVQMAAYLILEPIFEADFEDCSYGFRRGRNAHQALDKLREHIKEGFKEVYDADLKGYFDTIPHDKLMKALDHRITTRVLRHDSSRQTDESPGPPHCGSEFTQADPDVAPRTDCRKRRRRTTASASKSPRHPLRGSHLALAG